jgi:hypothetical protein
VVVGRAEAVPDDDREGNQYKDRTDRNVPHGCWESDKQGHCQ